MKKPKASVVYLGAMFNNSLLNKSIYKWLVFYTAYKFGTIRFEFICESEWFRWFVNELKWDNACVNREWIWDKSIDHSNLFFCLIFTKNVFTSFVWLDWGEQKNYRYLEYQWLYHALNYLWSLTRIKERHCKRQTQREGERGRDWSNSRRLVIIREGPIYQKHMLKIFMIVNS